MHCFAFPRCFLSVIAPKLLPLPILLCLTPWRMLHIAASHHLIWFYSLCHLLYISGSHHHTWFYSLRLLLCNAAYDLFIWFYSTRFFFRIAASHHLTWSFFFLITVYFSLFTNLASLPPHYELYHSWIFHFIWIFAAPLDLMFLSSLYSFLVSLFLPLPVFILAFCASVCTIFGSWFSSSCNIFYFTLIYLYQVCSPALVFGSHPPVFCQMPDLCVNPTFVSPHVQLNFKIAHITSLCTLIDSPKIIRHMSYVWITFALAPTSFSRLLIASKMCS